MSKRTNLVLVLMAFAMDIYVGYMWYMVLYPIKPITVFTATLCGALLAGISLIILGLNALVFMVALAED